MKCPKCGFVSYAGLEQCKKCGYPFVKAAPKGSSSSLTSLFPEGVRAATPTPAGTLACEPERFHSALTELPTQPTSPPEPAPEQNTTRQSSTGEALPRPTARTWMNRLQDWREELSERVVNFPQTAGLSFQPDADPEENLELDFEDSRQARGYSIPLTARRRLRRKRSGFDLEIGEPAVSPRQRTACCVKVLCSKSRVTR